MTDNSTTTQPDPNISTEHQPDGDARRPGAKLDKNRDADTAGTSTQPKPNISTEN